ncbi:MAG: type II secretion system protein [Geodermatophilaceae bacterium]|nr:type II secretion system protein [Geodermatophilaceae bacterium]
MTTRAATPVLRRDSGVTLAEMMVALGIITMVILAAVGSFGVMLGAQRNAEAVDQAAQLARDRIETTRLIPYDLLGFPTSAAGYGSTYGAENTVTLPVATPGVPTPVEEVIRSPRTFTVTTDISWTAAAVNAGLPVVTTANQSFKRVHVTITWEQGSASKTFESETFRAQSATDTPVEPGRGPGQATCNGPDASAICSVYVTEGVVLNTPAAGSATSTTTRSLDFRVTLDVVPMSVKASVGTANLTLGPTGDGTSWMFLLPAGSTVPVGASVVTFTARVAGVDQSFSVDVRWSYADTTAVGLAPAAGTWLNGSFFSFLSPDPSTFRGDESLSTVAYLCVSSSTGTLFRDAAFMFDVSGIKDADGPFRPDVTYLGTAAGSTIASPILASLSAQNIGRPTVSTAAVGKIRWYVLLPRTTVFHASSTELTFLVTRPQDGLPVAVILSVPVQFKTSVASCV